MLIAWIQTKTSLRLTCLKAQARPLNRPLKASYSPSPSYNFLLPFFYNITTCIFAFIAYAPDLFAIFYLSLHPSYSRHFPQPTPISPAWPACIVTQSSGPSRASLLQANTRRTQNYWTHRLTAYPLVNAHCLNPRRQCSECSG